MPERRTSSVTSFVSNLHFSGKVIMASVLFGFGLLLVGAILLIIATGGQKRSILQETAEKKSAMVYVGPGVMGVGGFFVVVGTIMCLFETRILRRRKNTDHESLVGSEILPTGNTPRTEGQEGSTNAEETQVKTVQATCHAESPAKSLEKTPHGKSAEEKDYDRQLSTSTDKEKTQSFTASVYVEAVGENDTDENDNDEHFTSGSMQFSTPPESREAVVPKFSLGGQPTERQDSTKIPIPAQATHVTEEAEEESSLLPQKENESVQTVSEGNESSLVVPKDAEVPVLVSNDSTPTAVTDEKDTGLTEAAVYPGHVPESTKDLTNSDVTANQDSKTEMTQILSPTELPDIGGKDLAAPDSHEITAPSPQNSDATVT